MTQASKYKNQTMKPSGTSKGFQQGSKITGMQKPGAFLMYKQWTSGTEFEI